MNIIEYVLTIKDVIDEILKYLEKDDAINFLLICKKTYYHRMLLYNHFAVRYDEAYLENHFSFVKHLKIVENHILTMQCY